MINAAKHLENLSDYAKGIAIRIKVSGNGVTKQEKINLKHFYEKAIKTETRSLVTEASSDYRDHIENGAIGYDYENETPEERAVRWKIENRE